MRVAVAVSLLCACRFHFDAIHSGDDAGSDDGDGGLVDPTGDATPISGTQVQLSPTGVCAAAAWSGDRAGVVWREGGQTGTADVRFATLDVNGAYIETPMTIASALQNVDCPAVEWTGGQFLVAVSYGQLNRRDIDVITISGTNVGALQNVVADSGDSRSPKLIANGATAVVTWQDAGGANTNVLRRPLSATGTPTAVTATLSGAVSTNSPPAISTFGTGFVVAWAAANGPHLRVLDGNGNATGVERVLSTGGSPTTNDPLAVASLAAGSTVALAWCAFAGNEVNTAVSDATGTATGPVKTFAAAASRQPVFAESPAGFGLVYLETSGLVQLHLAVVDTTGQVVRDVPLANATTSSRATVEWIGTHYLVAYDSNQGSFVKFIPPP